jgi:hypothetical protein
MRPSLRAVLPIMLMFALLAAPVPAGAGHTADAHSQGMQLRDHFPRSSVQTQSDLAFAGDLAVAGNYNGFRVFDISNPNRTHLVADVWCPGAQNDVSVWGDLVILSVDQVMTGPDCGAPPAASARLTDLSNWEGLRVFRLSDVLGTPADADGFVRVQPVRNIYTDCGSHTHTLVPDPDDDRLVIYVSSYPLRSGPTCGPGLEHRGVDPLHRKISVVDLALDDLSSRVTPAFLRPGMAVWTRLAQDPSFPPGTFNPMVACHDIQVFVELELAAAACASEGQLWDISDPANPNTADPIWHVADPNVQFYHSGMFSNDGSITVFGDEVVTGTSCEDPSDMHGRLWFYDTDETGELFHGDERSSFMIPRMQGGAYCTAHLFNPVPVKGRDVMVSSWYSGGVSVIDFSDPENPTELSFFDRADTVRGHWSAYWYNGMVYANDLDRGFDVIHAAAARRGGPKRLPFLNPQTQMETL